MANITLILNSMACSHNETTNQVFYSEFELLANQFVQFHKDPLNVFLHFVTTPMGLLGALGLLRYVTNSSSLVSVLILGYMVSLLPSLSSGVFIGTAIIAAAIFALVRRLELSFISCMILIVGGYMMQDAAHVWTGEKTFQQSYTKGDGAVSSFLQY